MSEGARPGLASVVTAFEERQAALEESLASRRARLPLRFWRQQAHLTAPADPDIGRKALAGGSTPVGRIMERLGVAPADLADRLGVDRAVVETLLERPRPAPVVMLDAEDALAPTAEAARHGREAAVEVLSMPAGSVVPRSLRFFRPPGVASGATARELLPVLWGLAERSDAGSFPLDGIVIPKIEQPEEVDFVDDMLGTAEKALGIEVGSLRTALMIESGAGITQLDEIARRSTDRICALIFGLADYSADLGLPAIRNEHPAAEWARARIVSVAAAVGVPAIDGMTLDYPVADPGLDAAANRERFLERMALVFDDAVHARDAGMLGKWVGHPAQLFAVLLAFDSGMSDEALETEAAKLVAYDDSIREDGTGATIIDGVMSDRATDRHARVVLRHAVAMDRFEPARAFELGVIDEAELAELRPDTQE